MMRSFSSAVLACACALAFPSAAVRGADGETIYQRGGAQPAAMACVSCHGPDALGMAAGGFPRLAGLPSAYMARQIADFRSGARDNPIMAPIAKALSDAEVDAVSGFLAALPAPATRPARRVEAASGAGETIALRGAWERSIPECVSCHGPGGVGVGERFPPLAGQPASYLAAQLAAWRAGTRSNDPDDLMGHIARSMTEAEVAAVSTYFAGLAGNEAIAEDDRTGKDAGTARDAAPQGTAPAAGFRPPPESDLPDDAFGDLVRRGRAIFVDTRNEAAEYVGNGMACANCHLEQGRRADSAPLWASYTMYPAYRRKNDRVNSYAERLQGCFQFSMNGKAPPADGEVIAALSAFSYWMARGAPTGVELAGRGYPEVPQPAGGFDIAQGRQVYEAKCAICHGDDGQGRKVEGDYVFPPLWGADSYNWGAGMHRINTAAAFIKANMPLGKGGSLSDAEAWNVAAFMNSHERPQDPRLVDGSVEKTRERFHANDGVNLYGVTVNGVLLGQGVR
jgi:thiosulfate dehydrogenase